MPQHLVEFRNYPNTSTQIDIYKDWANIFWHFSLYTINVKIFKSTCIKILSVVILFNTEEHNKNICLWSHTIYFSVVRPPWQKVVNTSFDFNPLNAKLNRICHLLALLGAHHILHVSRIRVNIKYKTETTRKIVPRDALNVWVSDSRVPLFNKLGV